MGRPLALAPMQQRAEASWAERDTGYITPIQSRIEGILNEGKSKDKKGLGSTLKKGTIHFSA